ncbi:MAG: carotenoid 1,2-hydratase [Planctomycetota bacterium]
MNTAAHVLWLGLLQQLPGDFARVTAPVPLVFPRDHGAHPDYRTEWWYFTGNVEDQSRRRYGFQLTFFRSGVAASVADRQSRFAVRDLWFAHFAIADVAAGEFFVDDRTDRGSFGTAGAAADRMQVWLRDWRADSSADQITLAARSGSHQLDVVLAPLQAPVRHGDRGYSKKARPMAARRCTCRSPAARSPASSRPSAARCASPGSPGSTTSSDRACCPPTRWDGTGSRCSSTAARS